jgi:hypothetical protein
LLLSREIAIMHDIPTYRQGDRMDSIGREYTRSRKKIRAMISISIEGTGDAVIRSGTRDKGMRLTSETKDISWSGFCLKFSSLPDDPEKRFSPSRAHKLVGKTVRVTLSKPGITLWGDVVRFDSAAREMAVVITKVSDYDLWQEVCDAQAAG